IPRVLYKLSLPFNPNGHPISKAASSITHLNEDILANSSPFNRTAAELIINFFLFLIEKDGKVKNSMSKICLITHNADKFDLGILRKYLFQQISDTGKCKVV
ncbi:MAG: nucleic acid binding, partial [Paramarteilia canceri]